MIDDNNKMLREITVGANKGCSFYFNLAKKMLKVDEVFELTALEGAIVCAVDAAHLLERTKHATIIRVETSSVLVPRKGNRGSDVKDEALNNGGEDLVTPSIKLSGDEHFVSHQMNNINHDDFCIPPTVVKNCSSELRRARISIQMQRTENYKKWLQECTNQNHDDPDEVHVD